MQYQNRYPSTTNQQSKSLEAARVLIEYGKDVRGCVQALAHGNLFSEARRIVSSMITSAAELLLMYGTDIRSS